MMIDQAGVMGGRKKTADPSSKRDFLCDSNHNPFHSRPFHLLQLEYDTHTHTHTSAVHLISVVYAAAVAFSPYRAFNDDRFIIPKTGPPASPPARARDLWRDFAFPPSSSFSSSTA